MKTCLWGAGIAALVLLLTAPFAEAKERSEAETLVKRLTQLRKAGDQSELSQAVDEVADIYKRTGPAAEKTKLRKELGKIAKQKDLGMARSAAVRALVALDDPKLAWQELSSLLPAAKVAEASDLDLSVVQAAGGLAQDKAVKPLLGLVGKAKDPRLAAAAAEALGGFRTPPKTRLFVLKELFAAGARLAAAAGAEGAKEAVVERWKVLDPAFTQGLNQVSGQTLTSFEEWRALWETHKADPKQILTGAAD